MVVPVGGGGPGTEGVFEAAVEAFYQSVGLGMVSGGRGMLDVKLVTKPGP